MDVDSNQFQDANWKRKVRRIVEVIALQVLISLVQIVPFSACQRLARGLTYLIHDIFKFRRKVIFENIKGVYPRPPKSDVISWLVRCGIT